MKKLALVLTFASIAALAASGVARAEIGTADQVPAATLLLPYFEVDLADPNGVSTTFTVNNASATAIVGHVTLWTDEGVPTFNFDIYLTGYDMQTVSLRALFDSGILPITADFQTDVNNGGHISPKGPLSQDINFPGSTGPCNSIYSTPELTATELRHIRTAHTGRRSAVLNGCAGGQYGDLIARGYVTVDTVNTCTTVNPTDSSYFDPMNPIATSQNVLWGDYNILNEASRGSFGNTLVPIEACTGAVSPPLYEGVGNGAGLCPFATGSATFYGRLNGFTATDQREPLATTFAARYLHGGAFDSTDLLVWRDPKAPVTGQNAKHACKKDPTWFPLSQSDTVAFDETENPTDLCFVTDNVSPAIGGTQPCFPLAAQRVSTSTGNPLGKPLLPPATFGWLYMNLNHTLAVNDPLPGVAQAWVDSVQIATGRYSVGYHGTPFDNADKTSAGGFVLIP